MNEIRSSSHLHVTWDYVLYHVTTLLTMLVDEIIVTIQSVSRSYLISMYHVEFRRYCSHTNDLMT